MHDNKIRLSQDVLQKAEMIATEWGLKNARAAVEAVFRRYSDDYLYRNGLSTGENFVGMPIMPNIGTKPEGIMGTANHLSGCAALDELDDLLAM
ncbi:MAG: hypothetical protein F6K19_31485 [Cyanothece sp. SIO1E1]|nr:hypothetical protein [Cyanothece sp. SIO1E1]